MRAERDDMRRNATTLQPPPQAAQPCLPACPGMPRQPRRCYCVSMLKRSHVAKRLGRSLATVRRLEGVELHPIIDEDGVHLFDEAEVDEVAMRGRRDPSDDGSAASPTKHAPSAWLRAELARRAREDDEDREHTARLQAQRAELEALDRQRAEERDRRQRIRETEERRAHAAARARLDAIREDVALLLADASPRELRRIARDPRLMHDLERILGGQ